MRSEHAWLPAHEDPTTTGPGQVGIAFSGHHRIPWESGERSGVTDIAPGSTIVTGGGGIAGCVYGRRPRTAPGRVNADPPPTD